MQQSFIERMTGNNKIKLGGIGGLTADVIIFLAHSENARKFVAKPRIAEITAKNDKLFLTNEEYLEFSRTVPNSAKDTYPGGSVFNTYSGFKGMNPDSTEVRIVTVIGANLNALNARKRAKDLGIEFLPKMDVDLGIEIATPVSYVCIGENGKKITLKHRGTIGEFLESHPEYLEQMSDEVRDTVAWSNVFFLPAGVTQVYTHELYDTALNSCIQNNRAMIHTDPTHTDISDKEAQRYKRARDFATFRLANLDEFVNTQNAINRLYGYKEIKKPDGADVLKEQMSLQYRMGNNYKIAMVTDGINDTYAYEFDPTTKDVKVTTIKPLPDPEKISTTLGCGDNSYSGLLEVLNGYSVQDAAILGQYMSNAVLQVPQAQLDNPLAVKLAALEKMGNPEPNSSLGAAILGSKTKGR